MDMSSSLASPQLKRAARKTTRILKTQKVSRTLPMSAGKVNLLSKYFEDRSKTNKKKNKQPEQCNNNMLSDDIELGPNKGVTAVYGTPTYPEMSYSLETPPSQ